MSHPFRPRRGSAYLVLTAAGAGILGITGCGGGDSGTPTSGSPLVSTAAAGVLHRHHEVPGRLQLRDGTVIAKGFTYPETAKLTQKRVASGAVATFTGTMRLTSSPPRSVSPTAAGPAA